MGTLTINVPGTPEGTLIEVPPFGVFPNGTTTDLTDDDLDKYEEYMRYLTGDPNFEVDEDILIPTPTQEPTVEAVVTPEPVSTESETEEDN